MLVQFISVQTLKENSVIQSNVDEKILTTAIKEYQELELEDLLGESELARISNVILAANSQPPTGTISPSDETLIAHIRKVMIYGSLMYSITPLNIKFSNKGTQELTDDHAKKRRRRGQELTMRLNLKAIKRNYLSTSRSKTRLRAFVVARLNSTLHLCLRE